MRPTLSRKFFARDTALVARELLGAILAHETAEGLTSGRIVECEAYFGPGDPASHAHRGPTPRSAIMFGPPGVAYVYFTYGMYCLFNVVTADHGEAGAVLLRALEPLVGVDLMRRRRQEWSIQRGRRPFDGPDRELARGPGRLTIAMGIDLAENGRDLTGGSLYIGLGTPVADADVAQGPRVGISAGTERELRFYVMGDPHVSRG